MNPSILIPMSHTSSVDSSTSTQSSKREHADFEFGKILGEGSFSTVLLAKDLNSLKMFAVKMLDKSQLIKERKTKFAAIEKLALRKCDSDYVISLYYTFQDTYSLYFVLEYAAHGDLLGLIQQQGRFDLDLARFFIMEIAMGIEHIHSKGIIHRDVKPEVNFNFILECAIR
jgi:3-phosphoinositide dependent protein kinase-1